MAELIAQRVPIRGEAGTGYVLEDGYDMLPLMLTNWSPASLVRNGSPRAGMRPCRAARANCSR
jgi:predicted DNA-binding transcriptional regulator YafY